MPDRDREKYVVDKFCARMTVLERVPWLVVDRSDEQGCDAVVERDGEARAVDHSLLQGFESQRRDDALFLQILAAREKEIESHFPRERVDLTVAVRTLPGGKPDAVRKIADVFVREVIAAVRSVPVASRDYSKQPQNPPTTLELGEAGFIVFAIAARGIRTGLRGIALRAVSPAERVRQRAPKLAWKEEQERVGAKGEGTADDLLLETMDLALFAEFPALGDFGKAAVGVDTSSFSEPRRRLCGVTATALNTS